MRTAAQIMAEVTAGQLDADSIKVRETAHIHARDVVTGREEVREIATNRPCRLVRQADGTVTVEPLA